MSRFQQHKAPAQGAASTADLIDPRVAAGHPAASFVPPSPRAMPLLFMSNPRPSARNAAWQQGALGFGLPLVALLLGMLLGAQINERLLSTARATWQHQPGQQRKAGREGMEGELRRLLHGTTEAALG